jgi:Flp pilus assembly pilin Flp
MKKNSQSILEYALLVAVIAVALVGMGIYIARSTKANLKTVENQVNMGISTRDTIGPYTNVEYDCRETNCHGLSGPSLNMCEQGCSVGNTGFQLCLDARCGGHMEQNSCSADCMSRFNTAVSNYNYCVQSALNTGQSTSNCGTDYITPFMCYANPSCSGG